MPVFQLLFEGSVEHFSRCVVVAGADVPVDLLDVLIELQDYRCIRLRVEPPEHIRNEFLCCSPFTSVCCQGEWPVFIYDFLQNLSRVSAT